VIKKTEPTDSHSRKDNNNNDNIASQFNVSTAAEQLQVSQNAQKKC